MKNENVMIHNKLEMKKKKKKERAKLLKRGIPLYLMILPGLLFFLIFKYAPMGGLVIAFQDYDPFDGFLGSPWVGLDQFVRLFTHQEFLILLRNTMILSAVNLFLFFPAPIVVALLLNEVRRHWFRKSVQTIVYIPHFVSWVVVVSITLLLFAPQSGGINEMLNGWGMDSINAMTDPDYFRSVYLFQNIWKDAGWNAIIFLAALAAVNPTHYEAAVVDGANRWQQVWHISLPSIRGTIVVLFILRIGHIMELGFEHIYLLQNPLNINVSDVFDTYVYRVGILSGEFSYTAAVGMFKAVVGLILVVLVNRYAKKLGEEGVY